MSTVYLACAQAVFKQVTKGFQSGNSPGAQGQSSAFSGSGFSSAGRGVFVVTTASTR